MSYTQREVLLAPSPRHRVQITRTNTTSLDLEIDIVVTKWFWRELIELEIRPVLRILDLEASECLWVNHVEGQLAFQLNNC